MNPGTVTSENSTSSVSHFGPALAQALRIRHVTQSELARRLAVTRTTVNEWVNDKSAPAPETVFKIERALGLPPGDLSIHLGFLPPDVRRAQPRSFMAFVRTLSELSDESKEAVIEVYLAMKKADAARALRGRRRADVV